MVTPKSILSCPLLLLLLLAASAESAEPRLVPVKRSTLTKPSGRVDQVVPLPTGGFLVRDADLMKEATQALEVYDASGHFVRKIGGFGQRPGSYQALKQIALGADGTIWVADLIGRLSLFDLAGKLLETKLIQAPGFQVEGIALDEPRGLLYLSGCVPIHTYVENGCKIIHQYSLKQRKYLKSLGDSDPKIGQLNLVGFSDNALDVDEAGRVWTVDAPILKLSRVDVATGKMAAFPIGTKSVKPFTKVAPGSDINAIFNNAFLLERVLAVNGAVVVSVRGPNGGLYLLETFDSQGRQTGVDLKSPGKLVGKTRSGNLLFAAPVKGGYEIAELRLEGMSK